MANMIMIAFMARVWLYAKCIEDDIQELIDPLPPGLKLQRVAGAGARTSPGDGLPGFIAKTMLTSYKVTNLEVNAHNQIVRLDGVGLDGTLTPAWVCH